MHTAAPDVERNPGLHGEQDASVDPPSRFALPGEHEKGPPLVTVFEGLTSPTPDDNTVAVTLLHSDVRAEFTADANAAAEPPVSAIPDVVYATASAL